MGWQAAGRVPVLSPQLWVTVGLSPPWDMHPFRCYWLIPRLLPCPGLVLWSQLTPSFPACGEEGLPVGDVSLQSSFRFPRWTSEASGITISASL